MKTWHFPKQKASEECPAVPSGVQVSGKTLAEATKKLAGVLKEDPKLEKKHPELTEESVIARDDDKPHTGTVSGTGKSKSKGK